jgi:hypothetical protein
VRHPLAARIVGGLAIVAPPVAAVIGALAVSILVPRPQGLGAAWWIAVIGTGIAVFMCGRRLERHAFALAALLGMAIVFPVRPPSRLRVVLTAARLPGAEAQARTAASGDGSGTKQAAVALAGALKAFDERTRREEPVLQRLGLGAVAVSIATIVASVTLGGTHTNERASRSRTGGVGGLAGGPSTPPAASSPALAPPLGSAGLAPTAPSAPAVSPVVAPAERGALGLTSSSAAASLPSTALPPVSVASPGGPSASGGGTPSVSAAAATTLVSSGSDAGYDPATGGGVVAAGVAALAPAASAGSATPVHVAAALTPTRLAGARVLGVAAVQSLTTSSTTGSAAGVSTASSSGSGPAAAPADVAGTAGPGGAATAGAVPPDSPSGGDAAGAPTDDAATP